jgi:lipopolysaccharide export system permease protein
MTLFNYIIKDFFKYVFGTVILCTFLFVMFDFIHRTTQYFSTYKPKAAYIIQFYMYQLPTLMVQALPIASLLGSVTCMVLLSRTNEITAMRAAGMGPLHIGAPIAIGGIILGVLSFGLGEFVAPLASKKMRYVQEVLIEGEAPGRISEGSRWLRQGANLYYFDEYDPVSGRLTNVRIIETGLNFRPKQAIEALYAEHQNQTGDWKLSGIKVIYFNPNGTIAFTERRESQVEIIPVEPKKLQKERRKPGEFSLSELNDIIGRGHSSGIDVSKYEIDLHFKFAFYFAAFVVCLVGLKFGYRSERSVETARGIILAIGIGMSYWFIHNASRALGTRGTVPPVIAAWMANLLVLSVASYEIWRTTNRKT